MFYSGSRHFFGRLTQVFQLEFTSALRGSRVELTTLSLTRVERPTSEPDLTKVATRLATTNPSLQRITLRYSFTTWVFLDSIPYHRSANFSVKPGRTKLGSAIVEEKLPLPRRRGFGFYQRPLSLQLPRWL